MNVIKVAWLVMTGILLLFPVGFLLYALYIWLNKVFVLMKKKIENVKALEKMKNDLLKQSAGEYMGGGTFENIVDNKNSEIFSDEKKKENTMQIKKMKEKLPKSLGIYNIKKNDKDDKKYDKKYDKNEKIISEKHRQEVSKIIFQVEGLKNDGKFGEYEKKIIEGLSLDPYNIELNKKLADLYFSRQEHKKALSLLKKIIEKNPNDHASLWQIGEIYLSNQDYNTAEMLVSKAIDINTENPKYYMSMVEIYYSTDRYIEAVQMMEKIIKLRPENPKYLQILAEIYDELGDEDNAVKYYFRLLETDPSNAKAKKRLNQ